MLFRSYFILLTSYLMKILSLAPTSFFGDYGCHVRILEEARALKALGHDVTILTYYKGNNVPGVPGFKVIRTNPTPWHKDYEVGSSRHKFAFDALLAVRLLRVLSKNTFDVIHAHLHEGALIAGTLAKAWRIPVCFDYQGSLTDEMKQHGFVRRNWAISGASKLERFINRLPNAIFTSTKHAAESLQQELGPNHAVQHLPDGVNADVFTPHVLSPDERVLYVSDSEANFVRAYDVAVDGSLSRERAFIPAIPSPDGMAIDVAGNLFVAAGDGIRVYAPSGTAWFLSKKPTTN